MKSVCVCVYVNSIITSQEAHHDSLQKNTKLFPGIILYIIINSDVSKTTNAEIVVWYTVRIEFVQKTIRCLA